MISLEALGAVLNTVDTATVAGRSGLPMLQFKREGDGTWLHGQRRTVVEDGSRWAVNPMTFRRGHICFADKKVARRALDAGHPADARSLGAARPRVPVGGAVGR